MKESCSHGKMISFFKAICDNNRHKILHLLHKGKEMNASDIIKQMDLSQPTIAHHLKILVDANVITARKEGKETFYKINKGNIHGCCRGFADLFH